MTVAFICNPAEARVCHSLFSTGELRATLGDGVVELAPIEAGDAKLLKGMFEEPEIRRRFLGESANVDAMVDMHVSRAANPHGDSRMRFDGAWIIRHQGEPAGLLMMTAANSSWLPEAYTKRFRKKADDELHLLVGYALSPKFRGKGLASRSLATAIAHAKSALDARFVFAGVRASNEASLAVLSRNGFVRFTPDGEERTKHVLDLSGTR
jgi:RimJ/RimL family protein N-acetyltransferase